MPIADDVRHLSRRAPHALFRLGRALRGRLGVLDPRLRQIEALR
jgi:hypothetical protein